MKNYLEDYVKYIDNKIEKGKISKKDIEDHLVKISFFQHERFIHLIVTIFYALFMLITFALININVLYSIISLILMIFVIFYIKHYFSLENNVQYLYKQYDKLKEKETN